MSRILARDETKCEGVRSQRAPGSDVLACLTVASSIAKPEGLGLGLGLGAARGREAAEQLGRGGEGSWQSHGPPLWAEAGLAAGAFPQAGW